jgi:hypothetical protein
MSNCASIDTSLTENKRWAPVMDAYLAALATVL